MNLLTPFVLGRITFVAVTSLLIAGAILAMRGSPALAGQLAAINIAFWALMSVIAWTAQSRSTAAAITALLVLALPAFLGCTGVAVYAIMVRGPMPWLCIGGAITSGFGIWRIVQRLGSPQFSGSQ